MQSTTAMSVLLPLGVGRYETAKDTQRISGPILLCHNAHSCFATITYHVAGKPTCVCVLVGWWQLLQSRACEWPRPPPCTRAGL